jgi:hypothetical protein
LGLIKISSYSKFCEGSLWICLSLYLLGCFWLLIHNHRTKLLLHLEIYIITTETQFVCNSLSSLHLCV